MASGLVLRTWANRLSMNGCLNRHLSAKRYTSKVPSQPVWKPIDQKNMPEVPELDSEMINHLERLSLVEFNNKEGVERLRSAIEYANQLHVVDTDGVEPMYSILEDRELLLTEDKVSDGNCRKEILQNATKTEEDYFVAPPGNIPLKQNKKSYKKQET